MKTAAKAMEFEKTPVNKAVKPGVAVKEIERAIDNFGFGRLTWYIMKRYRFQISILVNAYFLGVPVYRFVSQFFK